MQIIRGLTKCDFFLLPVAEQRPLDIWLNDTYQIDDIIEHIMAPGPFETSPRIVLNQTGWYADTNVTLLEVSTVYGRCYAIHFSAYTLTSHNDFFTLKFNMSRHEELFLYFHEDYDEIGLNWGYYPILPIQIIIGRRRHYTVSVRTNLFKPYNNKGCLKTDDYSYPECVVKWARKRYVEMFKENNRTGGLGFKLNFTL